MLHTDDVFESHPQPGAPSRIQEADLMIFMVDVTTGITDLDESLARRTAQDQKPGLLPWTR